MGAKDDSEKILREIHVLFAKAEAYEDSRERVVVNKEQVFDLLEKLNGAITDMVDECELTWAERDKAYRRQRRQGDEIVSEARHKAEDVYAASVMYTDRSLEEIQDLVNRTSEELDEIHRQMKAAIETELRHMRDNQTELHGQLRDMADSQKYLHLIDDENRRIAREKEKAREADRGGTFVPLSYAGPAPEIRVNPAYFERRAQMIAAEDEAAEEGAADQLSQADLTEENVSDQELTSRAKGEAPVNQKREAKPAGEKIPDQLLESKAKGERLAGQKQEAKPVGKKTPDQSLESKVEGEDLADQKREAKPAGEKTPNQPLESRIKGESPADQKRKAKPAGEKIPNQPLESRAKGESPADRKREAKLAGEKTPDQPLESSLPERDSRENSTASGTRESDPKTEIGAKVDTAISGPDQETRRKQNHRQDDRVDKVLQIFRKSGNP
ncbi:hypothetical protein [Shuttleworthella satelles]|uniref:hypothetical protein n=1 Tax=Shuttleworthella satelles TaxID=177972 RepID=UPI0028D1B36A|nr:hypothetical protein [Shuttleworthia satelles]